MSLLAFEIIVYLLNELVGVSAVYGAGFLNGLTAGVRATEAVHADLEEESCSLNVKVENLAYKGIFCNFHLCFLAFVFVTELV